MRRISVALLTCLFMAACGTSKKARVGRSQLPPQGPVAVFIDSLTSIVNEVSTDKTYGYSQANPILVGGSVIMNGPLYERAYLDALAGPQGQKLSYKRLGSCCHFKTENSPFGTGLLDVYEITYDSIENPVRLYLNMYDPGGKLRIPYGFTLAAQYVPREADSVAAFEALPADSIASAGATVATEAGKE